MFITTLVNTFGVSAAAAVGIAGKFEGFAMLPATALRLGDRLHGRPGTSAHGPARAGLSHDENRYRHRLWGVADFFFAWAQISPASVLGVFQADREVIAAGAYLRAFSSDHMAVA